MVAGNKLEAFGDAMEVAELCIETAQGLKQSLKDVRVGGPAGVAAASSSLAMAKSLVSLAKTATDVLTKAKTQWMLTAGIPPPPGAGYGVSPGSGSRPGSRMGGTGASPGSLTPGSAGGTGGQGQGQGQAAARKKTKSNNTTTNSKKGATVSLGPGVGPMGSLASPAPYRVSADLSDRSDLSPVLRDTTVPTDPDADAAGRDVDADPSLADVDDLIPRRDLPFAPTRQSSSSSRMKNSEHKIDRRDAAAAEAGEAEADLTPWERQMAKFKRRQAQLKEHERRARRAARKAFKESRGVRLHRHAYAFATETVLVKRAGSNADPVPVIHHRAVNAAPERAAEEIMDLLSAVQSKLKMGVPIASLINAASGEELDFEAYTNPGAGAGAGSSIPAGAGGNSAALASRTQTSGAGAGRGVSSRGNASATPRVFPPGVVYVALTAAEIAARRLQLGDASFDGGDGVGSGDERDRTNPSVNPGAELAALPWMGLGSDTLAPEQAAAVQRLSRAAPQHSRLLVHVSRVPRGAKEVAAPPIPVMIPSSVSSMGELRSRVSEALRSHEVAFTPCVALYHADDASMGGPSETIEHVAELVDGQRLLFRCADDLAPGMGDNARAARRQKKLVKKMAAPAKGKVDSFRVHVARKADPAGRAVDMRLPGAKALAHLTFDDICRRVRIAAGLPADTPVRGLFSADGTRLVSPADIAPGMRLLYSTKATPAERRRLAGAGAGPGGSAVAKAAAAAGATTMAKTMRVSGAPPLRPASSLARRAEALEAEALGEVEAKDGWSGAWDDSWGARVAPPSRTQTQRVTGAGVAARAAGGRSLNGQSVARPASAGVVGEAAKADRAVMFASSNSSAPAPAARRATPLSTTVPVTMEPAPADTAESLVAVKSPGKSAKRMSLAAAAGAVALAAPSPKKSQMPLSPSSKMTRIASAPPSRATPAAGPSSSAMADPAPPTRPDPSLSRSLSQPAEDPTPSSRSPKETTSPLPSPTRRAPSPRLSSLGESLSPQRVSLAPLALHDPRAPAPPELPPAGAEHSRRNPSPLPSPTKSAPAGQAGEEAVATTRGISPGRVRPPRRSASCDASVSDMSDIVSHELNGAGSSGGGSLSDREAAPARAPTASDHPASSSSSRRLMPLEPLPSSSGFRGGAGVLLSPTRGLMPGFSPPDSPAANQKMAAPDSPNRKMEASSSLPLAHPPSHLVSPGSPAAPRIPHLDVASIAKKAAAGNDGGDDDDDSLPALRAMSVMDLMRNQQAGAGAGAGAGAAREAGSGSVGGSGTEEEEEDLDDDLDVEEQPATGMHDEESGTEEEGEEENDDIDMDNELEVEEQPAAVLYDDASGTEEEEEEEEEEENDDIVIDNELTVEEQPAAVMYDDESGTEEEEEEEEEAPALDPAPALEPSAEAAAAAAVMTYDDGSATDDDGVEGPAELDDSLGTEDDEVLEEEIDEIPEDLDDDEYTAEDDGFEDDMEAPELP